MSPDNRIDPLQIIPTSPQLTAVIPITVRREEIRKVMGPGLAELKAELAAQNIAVTGPWFAHHVRHPGETFDFEICLPVAKTVAPSGRVQPGLWPAMTVVRTTYHGNYEGLGAAWGEFLEQINVAGLKTAGDLWERYVVGPEASADPAAWQTELSKPLVGT